MKDFVEKTRYRRAAISPDRAVLRSDAARMIELYRKIES